MRFAQVSLVLLVAVVLAGGVALAGRGPGPLPPADCPDHDADGICNGQDPDYVPGETCPDPECPNPDCPDADGDGVCNGQDPDYTPPGDGPKRIHEEFGKLAIRAMRMVTIGFPAL